MRVRITIIGGVAATEPIPTIAWLRPDQVPLVRAVSMQAGLHITGVGSPDPLQTGAVAQEFDAEPLNDLRGAIATANEGLVLIAAPGSFGARSQEGGVGTRLDAEELDAAEQRGVRVVSFEPIPASLTQLVEAGSKPSEGRAAVQRGLWCAACLQSRHLSAVIEARELLETFGPVRAMRVECLGTPAEGSLGARLLDAMDLVHLFLGEPEQVHAAHTSASAARGVHQAPSDSLRFLHGDMVISCRFGDNRAASALVSNQAGVFGMSVTLIGQGGRIILSEGTLTWVGVDGRDAAEHGSEKNPLDAVSLITRQLMDRKTRSGKLGPMAFARVMGMAQAAVLSARTGEPESPGTMLTIAGVMDA